MKESKLIKILSCFIPNKNKRRAFRNKYNHNTEIQYDVKSSIIENNGKNNRLIILDDSGNETDIQYLPLLGVRFKGDDNTIILHKNTDFVNYKEIVCSSNNCIKIGKSRILDISVTPLSEGFKLVIGDGCHMGYTIIELHREPGLEVNIGDECLFSRDIEILPSDGHAIFDYESNEILNYPKKITIGNHVWLARHAKILKGSVVPNNSVVGMSAVFVESSNIKQEANNGSGYVFAGLPAKVIKSGINWNILHTIKYEISKGKKNVIFNK